MANLVISGDTSGSVTLAAPAVSGTTVLTLPTTTGTLVVTGGAQTVQFAAGSAAAPSITFTGDTNTGMFSPGADTIAFTEGGVESMRIDASGNMGIGTTSPSFRLDVQGSSGVGIRLLETSTGNNNRLVISQSGTSTIYNSTYASGSANHVWQIADIERMRIDSAGNVGIGIAPAAWSGFKALQINSLTNFWNNGAAGGASYYSNNLYYNGSNRIYQTTGFASEYTMGSGIHTWSTASSGTAGNTVTLNESMRIASNGYVGIGTSGPAGILDVVGGGSASTGNWVYIKGGNVGSSNPSIAAGVAFGQNFSSGNSETNLVWGQTIGSGQYLSISKWTGSAVTEQVRVNSAGEFFIQCTGIDVDRPNVAGGTLKQTNGNTKVRVTGDGTAAFQFYSPTGGTSTVGAISANAASTTYATTSDYRLKEKIAPMTGALAKIALLKPVTYKWKSNGANGQGFIAHELQEVSPDCVTGEKDAVREDGVPIYQGVDTSFLVATLTAAIQEQQALITQLQADVAALKGAK
jgi:hypothetical protein